MLTENRKPIWAAMLSLLDHVRTQLAEASTRLSFDRHNELDRAYLSLYLTALGYAEEIAILVQRGTVFSVPLIVRSMLECFVDMRNLQVSPDYATAMRARAVRAQCSMLEYAKKGGNPYLNGDGHSLADIDATEWHSQREALAHVKVPRQKRDLFKNVDMINEYESIYAHLSEHVHNGLSALTNRHTEIGVDDFTLTNRLPVSDEPMLDSYLVHATGLLLSTAMIVFEKYAISDISIVTALDAQYQAVLKEAVRGPEGEGETGDDTD
ncbi:MAG: DUF5677 domain-containing protein [Burkholderiaceae bacterium]